VEPIGKRPDGTQKRALIALDVSGSMGGKAAGWADCTGIPLAPREAAGAISLVTMNADRDAHVVGFCAPQAGAWSTGQINRRYGQSTGISELDISPRRRLDDVVRYLTGLPAGGTDIALPMIWAAQNRLEFDAFQIYTDNETWAGSMHPYQALEDYRQKMQIDARMAVAAMTATECSVCDPMDVRQMDVAGFDRDCPQLIADFSAGRL